MNSPYEGKFKVTQTQHSQHDGLDLVGIDSKEIHATVNGTVHYAGWENASNPKQGFGQYVCIRSADNKYYYYGHMSVIKVKTGDKVKCTDVIGVEGHTGHTIPDNEYGSHCHYCIRPQFAAGNALSTPQISGIPNACGVYDDGYRPSQKPQKEPTEHDGLTGELKLSDGTIYNVNLTKKT